MQRGDTANQAWCEILDAPKQGKKNWHQCHEVWDEGHMPLELRQKLSRGWFDV
jgi:hypothetical protein